MDTILSKTIITNAKAAVDSYIRTAATLKGELDDVLTNLSAGFQGDAAAGYAAFYTKTVAPAIANNLTTGQQALLPSLKGILDSIEKQLLDTVDPQMGQNNQNPGAAK